METVAPIRRRRRWLFQQPDAINGFGKRNADGEDARAIAIMRANPKLSVAKLSRLLAERGITRRKEGCRRKLLTDSGSSGRGKMPASRPAKRTMSAEGRERVAAAQRKRWAAWKKAAK